MATKQEIKDAFAKYAAAHVVLGKLIIDGTEYTPENRAFLSGIMHGFDIIELGDAILELE